METYGKCLQLILFINEDQSPRTLLKDALAYNPGYRPGDVIHLIQESHQTREAGPDRQYVVLSAKHVVVVGEAIGETNEHILLIEVAELIEAERDATAQLFELS